MERHLLVPNWQGRGVVITMIALTMIVLYYASSGALVSYDQGSEQGLAQIAFSLFTSPRYPHAPQATLKPDYIRKKSIAHIENASAPQLLLHDFSKVFVLGFAKTGTISLCQYFACGGLRVSHFQCGSKSCGNRIMSNLENNLPPLSGSEEFQVYTQLDFFQQCIFPQLEFETLDLAYPQAIFLLNTRPILHWIASLENWKAHRVNLVECDLPGMPRGVGSSDSDIAMFAEGHFQRVRDYFAGRPGKLVEVNIENKEETSIVLEHAFGIPRHCYGHHHDSPNKPSRVQIRYVTEKLQGNPIIHPALLPPLPETLEPGSSTTINGPSIIRMPKWVKKPLGRYYLYFTSSAGKSIRMAYAQQIQGPWTVLHREILNVSDMPQCRGHVASPDVVLLENVHTIRMYFHCPSKAGLHETFVSHSSDGLNFVPSSNESLGLNSFRAFQIGNASEWWAVCSGGIMYKSTTGINTFRKESDLFRAIKVLQHSDEEKRYRSVRNLAVLVEENHLLVVYSYIGDKPEMLLSAQMPLPIMAQHKPLMLRGKERELLRPTEPWEGADLPSVRSTQAEARGRANAVRDPALFRDADGQKYLFYSVAGESGIAVARLSEDIVAQ